MTYHLAKDEFDLENVGSLSLELREKRTSLEAKVDIYCSVHPDSALCLLVTATPPASFLGTSSLPLPTVLVKLSIQMACPLQAKDGCMTLARILGSLCDLNIE